jgi:hypothetical protein
MEINQMLYSSGISIGFYALYKILQNLYHKYYLKSECHQRTLEITVMTKEGNPDPEPEQKEHHDSIKENQ